MTDQRALRLKNYWTERKRLCKIEGNCNRCGQRIDDANFKACSKCREKSAKYARDYLLKQRELVNNASIIRRLESAELSIIRLQKDQAKYYASAWGKGFRAAEKRMKKQSAWDVPSVSISELKQITNDYSNL